MWDKAIPPDDGVVAQVLSLLIFQKASREEVTDWATTWYRNTAYKPEAYLREALHALTGADTKTEPHTYRFSEEDFLHWQSKLLKLRPADDRNALASVEERVVFHNTANQFAIHDVYFDAQGRVVAMTEDALSPHARSVAELEVALQRLLHDASNGVGIICGDLKYTYDREDIEGWLEALKRPLINDPFENED